VELEDAGSAASFQLAGELGEAIGQGITVSGDVDPPPGDTGLENAAADFAGRSPLLDGVERKRPERVIGLSGIVDVERVGEDDEPAVAGTTIDVQIGRSGELNVVLR